MWSIFKKQKQFCRWDGPDIGLSKVDIMNNLRIKGKYSEQ